MQQHFPNRASHTGQHTDLLNERLSESARFRRLPEKVHPDSIEQLDYLRTTSLLAHQRPA